MSNHWLPGRAPQQQWGMPPPAPVNQANQGWGEWQSLPPTSTTQQQQQLPVHQAAAGGYQGNQQYQPQQQPMNQKMFIQEQVARAREEQRCREVELQKQRMRAMNVAQATPLSSIDSLIALEGMSPSTRKRASTQHRPAPTTTAASQSSLNKPRAWTMDASNFEGVFSVPQEKGDDSFGEFQAPPPPQSGVGVVTGGVVLTSSYTRPISSVMSTSPVIGQRSRSTNSPHMPPRVQSQTTTSSGRDVDQSAFPPLYTEVYKMCSVNGTLSTELLFPVLMSSHLPKTLLGELWQQANRGVPGKLSQTELFVLLGLIGLAQTGHPNPKFADLQKAPAPPLPVLDKMRKVPLPTTTITTGKIDDFGSFQQGPSAVSNHSENVPSSSVLSFGASTLSPSVNTSVFDTTQKYNPVSTAAPQVPAATNSEFGEFKTATTATDKFAAFDALKGTSEEPIVSSSKVLEFGQFNSSSLQPITGPGTLPATSTISTAALLSQSSSSTNLMTADSSKQPSAEFGSFASVSISTSLADFSNSSSTTMGWADFTSHPLPLDTGHAPRQPLTTKSAPVAPPLSLGFDSAAVLLKETETESKPKKPLTGLEILDAEMEARLLAKQEDSFAPSVDKPLVPESLDDFGDFETFGGSSQVKSVTSQESDIEANKPPPDSCEVWRKCLCKCVEVLEVCAGVFGGVEEAGLREEIAQSEEGRNKLKGVVEVYRLARRVYASLRDKDQGAESADYTRAIRTHWSTLTTQLPSNVMEELYSETTPTNDAAVVSDVLSDTISKCSLCLTSKTVAISTNNSLDGRPDSYPLTLLFHNGQTYHASCANFWINVVQEELPVLA